MKLYGNIISIIYRSATGKIRYRPLITIAGFLFFLTVVVLLVTAAFKLDKLFNFPVLLKNPLSLIVSIPLMCSGLFIVLWCVIFFLKAKGTPVPLNPPKELITTGPYCYSRNPMTSGLIIFIFGLGVFEGSVTLTLILMPLIIIINYIELKFIEEPELEKRLGEKYLNYKKSVPMFFPLMRKKSHKNIV